uniref:Uncharacterized protein n=1 Tax=Timema tahoe TaxID=61484 RepID=A0A7R9ID07_9NEOP|nr:unnamed protein product [Timema tahoe]
MSDNKRDFGTWLIYFLAMISQEFRWLVNRRIEQRQEHSITRTEITQRGQPELQQTSSYSVDVSYHPTNGHPDNLSPNSSHLSVHSGDVGNLVSRTQNQQTTQQVTTLTKVVREVHHVGPDGQPVDYVGVPYSGVLPTSTAPTSYAHPQFSNYEILGGQEHYPPMDPARHYPEPYHPSYQDYEQYPYTNPPYAGAFPAYGETVNYVERPPTPPSPSEQSESPSLQPALQHGLGSQAHVASLSLGSGPAMGLTLWGSEFKSRRVMALAEWWGSGSPSPGSWGSGPPDPGSWAPRRLAVLELRC